MESMGALHAYVVCMGADHGLMKFMGPAHRDNGASEFGESPMWCVVV